MHNQFETINELIVKHLCFLHQVNKTYVCNASFKNHKVTLVFSRIAITVFNQYHMNTNDLFSDRRCAVVHLESWITTVIYRTPFLWSKLHQISNLLHRKYHVLTEKGHEIKGAKIYTHKNNQAHKVRVSLSLTKIDTHSPNLQVSTTY